jgi:TIR domain
MRDFLTLDGIPPETFEYRLGNLSRKGERRRGRRSTLQLLPGDDLHEGIDHGIRLWDKVLLCASKASLTSWWVDGEINRAFQKEAQIMKQRGKKVLALIPLDLDRFRFSADYQSGKKAEITNRVAANFVGWEKDHALFDRELEKVIRALRADEGGREKPPPARL